MKLILALLLCASLSQAAVLIKPDPNTFTYSASSGAFAPPASPTDMCELYGSATKVIKVVGIDVHTNQTTTGTNQIFYIKRSAANTGGGAITDTVVPWDSGFAAGTAVAKHYIATNPTTGTAVGSLMTVREIAAVSTTPLNFPFDILKVANTVFTPVTLRGVAEGIVVNFSGAALPTGFTISCVFKIAKHEGKKHQASIGDVREILSILSDLMADCPNVAVILYRNGIHRAFKKK